MDEFVFRTDDSTAAAGSKGGHGHADGGWSPILSTGGNTGLEGGDSHHDDWCDLLSMGGGITDDSGIDSLLF